MSLHWYDGMLVDLVVDSSATGGSYALMDVRARAGTRVAGPGRPCRARRGNE